MRLASQHNTSHVIPLQPVALKTPSGQQSGTLKSVHVPQIGIQQTGTLKSVHIPQSGTLKSIQHQPDSATSSKSSSATEIVEL